jgi:hypothetical protein
MVDRSTENNETTDGVNTPN